MIRYILNKLLRFVGYCKLQKNNRGRDLENEDTSCIRYTPGARAAYYGPDYQKYESTRKNDRINEPTL
jgi:hypothetical protein